MEHRWNGDNDQGRGKLQGLGVWLTQSLIKNAAISFQSLQLSEFRKDIEMLEEMCSGLCDPLSTCIIVKDTGTFNRRWHSPIQRVSS